MKRLALLVLLTACDAGQATELLVVVDSDLGVPAELDEIRVEVTGVEDMTASGSLTDEGLPRTVGVVHGGGPLGPVRIRAVGLLDGTIVVDALAITSFVEGRTLILPIFLSRRCRSVVCDANATCAAGNCTTAVVDSDTLEVWDGTVPRLDGGSCDIAAEACNEMDDDCDGLVDEGFDLEADTLNCGACGNACDFANGDGACNGGSCVLESCDAGFGNCDGDDSNGCELDVSSSLTDCGGCDMACAFVNASATCDSGTCTFGACNAGFGDCDAMTSTGCETATTTATDCGSCGTPCTFANAAGDCSSGTCAMGACNAGFDDCNGMDSDGCETAVNTLADCGSCGTACDVANGTPTCASGTCEIASCDAGFDDCNMMDGDGCEAPLNTLTDCGSCGTACARANATESCSTGTCTIVMCDPLFGDCNTSRTDGCERPLNTLTDCGMCGQTCALNNATEECTTGTCRVLMCNSLRGNCDMDDSDGCETDLRNNDANCGMCGNVCMAPTPNCNNSGVCRP